MGEQQRWRGDEWEVYICIGEGWRYVGEPQGWSGGEWEV